MKRGARRAGRAVAAAVAAALGLAAAMSLHDWRLNPGGIFHDATRTHWPVVWETFVSWLWPGLLVFGLLAGLALLLHARAGRQRGG